MRPTLIIWEYKSYYIILAISSNKNSWINYKIDNDDLSSGELLIKSYIKINKVTSIEKSIIFSKIWTVKNKIEKEVKKEFIDNLLK